MVDITVGNNEVTVDMEVYHSFNNRESLCRLIADIIDKAKYSGETISLWVTSNEWKVFIREWP